MIVLLYQFLIWSIFLKIVKGVETTDSGFFITPQNIERLKQAKEANRVQVCCLSSITNMNLTALFFEESPDLPAYYIVKLETC